VRFLFPSDYFNSKKIDEAYSEQADCLQNIGFETSVLVGWTSERFAKLWLDI
jgi:hypothetical protein